MAVIQRPHPVEIRPSALRYRKKVEADALDERMVPYCASNKQEIVTTLVNMVTEFITEVWPNEHRAMPVRTVISEVLRRSKCSYPVLQVALCYLTMIRPLVMDKCPVQLRCGCRVFVASLMVASKYLLDRGFSTATWSRVSGLPTSELTANEFALLDALDWQCHIPMEKYRQACSKLILEMRQQSLAKRSIAEPVILSPDML